jgi:glycosyltransferase involved in cell wall biosynthesis
LDLSDFHAIAHSRDRSWAIIQKLATENLWIRGINLMRNYDQHNALLCGIRTAQYETLVTLDDDLQHAPEDIPKLIAKLEEGFDVVYGKPEKEPHGLWRGFASKLTKFALQRVMGVKLRAASALIARYERAYAPHLAVTKAPSFRLMCCSRGARRGSQRSLCRTIPALQESQTTRYAPL